MPGWQTETDRLFERMAGRFARVALATTPSTPRPRGPIGVRDCRDHELLTPTPDSDGRTAPLTAGDHTAVAVEQGRVTFLGILGRGAIEARRDFVSDTGPGARTHVIDSDGALWARFGVVSQPAFAFVDRSGAARTFIGSLGPDELRAMLDELT